MKKKLPEILIKLVFTGMELAFVGLVAYIRILNIGWMLIIFGLLLVLWILFHLGVMTAFIASLRLSIIDIPLYLLYLAIHFFYLGGWLLQVDGGDDGNSSWTINAIFSNPSLNAFLDQWGETLFWIMAIGAFICYLLIILVVIVRLIQWLRARNKSAQPL